MPKISIVVPVYNVEKYIDKCINSILNQTYTDFELLLIDDGSTDRSGEICDQYASIDERVCVIHKSNGGVSTARNIGIKQSKGDYIGFVDADDYIEEEMYEVLFKLIEDNKADISICGFKIIDEDIGKIERIQDSGKIEVLSQEKLVAKETDMPWSIRLDTINKLFRKEALSGLLFDENLHCAEDTLFLHQAIMRMNKGVFIELPLYVNVRHSGSAMRGRLNPNNYYQSYFTDFSIYSDIKSNFPWLAERSYLVLLNNCIWKLEDVCRNLCGRANEEDKKCVKKMRKFLFRTGLHVFKCSEIGIKQKIGLFMLSANLKDRHLHYVK